MSAELKRITVETAGVAEIRDPELRVGQVLWVTVETDTSRQKREELAQEFEALTERTRAEAKAAGVTDLEIEEVIAESRRTPS